MNTRKKIRLEQCNYSQNGAYFITVCTKGKMPILSKVIGSAETITQLTPIGEIVDRAIQNMPAVYVGLTVDNYVIMPNHVHMLLRIDDDQKTGIVSIPKLIQHMKGYVTKQCGKPVWQKSYYDHIIRGESDYADVWRYIDANPSRWAEDMLYIRD